MRQLNNLFEAREELLREFVSASGAYKAELLTKIIDLDEQIEDLSN